MTADEAMQAIEKLSLSIDGVGDFIVEEVRSVATSNGEVSFFAASFVRVIDQ